MQNIRINTNIDVKKKAALIAVINRLDGRGSSKNGTEENSWTNGSKFRKKPNKTN